MSTPRPATVRATLLADVAALLGVRAPDAEAAVTGVTLDSRAVVPGDLYAALPGANAHGAAFASGAVERGAVAVLTDPAGGALLEDGGVDVPRVVVDEPRAVLGSVSSLVYGTQRLPLRLYGITGTNGKTTTAYLVSSALGALGQTTGLIGTVETRIGDERVKSVRTTPETTDLHALLAVMAERGLDACVMEVSSHALDLHRVDGVVYDVALFTNLSQDHLDFHGGMREYFLAKAALFTPERSRQGVVCVDDEWGRELAGLATVPVTTLSSRPDVAADWQLVADHADPMAFTLADGTTTLRLRSALPGDFNRVNTALAALALLVSGHGPAEVERACAADPHVPGRMEQVTVEGGEHLPRVVVDYAHTPEAVAAALRALRPTTPGRLVVVLGAGGDRDRGKRSAMGRAAAEHADLVFVTNDNPRSEDPAAIRAAVLAGAREAGTAAELHDVERRSLAIPQAVHAAYRSGPGSTVAVVGKGHETGQEVAGTIHPFDDREEVRKALQQLITLGAEA
ncbi:UDP-N-acetylmuramoyl-L-alanyl-D-glutamate--2,6-diaminopimelate ligase [Knoellia sp. 3-2P3]|uniref:UDP-N-acetylmuramoyl-L-alanyl-D-glutamate--2, 6-diaminopimelate ligase n=1 Tax=unclassified Knoellia TaxID=2618719 RepID=UPI0023DBD0DF|nr:UDP-N-acetylmuramoyl-L-alanyl-D-glutamate--2,6-diaminopimelate ligase [Knoellia sp. 3-2P3]MDF2092481.1 UDP-N-acetylmuramoyl-L-alanyl-D-glutamate--2,6-diaminopimelate ligase [Knoellia sp. 3-2P3]